MLYLRQWKFFFEGVAARWLYSFLKKKNKKKLFLDVQIDIQEFSDRSIFGIDILNSRLIDSIKRIPGMWN